MSLVEFFDSDDELVVTARLKNSLIDLTGFFDITEVDFYADNSEGPERAQFLCEAWTGHKNAVGDTLTVNSTDYQVIKIQDDGSGVVTLHLFQK